MITENTWDAELIIEYCSVNLNLDEDCENLLVPEDLTEQDVMSFSEQEGKVREEFGGEDADEDEEFYEVLREEVLEPFYVRVYNRKQTQH